jgi:hypothetical protein
VRKGVFYPLFTKKKVKPQFLWIFFVLAVKRFVFYMGVELECLAAYWYEAEVVS